MGGGNGIAVGMVGMAGTVSMVGMVGTVVALVISLLRGRGIGPSCRKSPLQNNILKTK